MKNSSHIKKMFALACGFLLFICTQVLAGQKSHIVFFEGEENELHVYRINGSKPGKTLLIIGGIQGDEPGGFLAADFYADFLLEKGNLIVVPRANFPSILKKERKINQDMNRKFLDDNISNYETKVVNVLKKLICESDCFLNLHEGSGIYSSKWESEEKNQKRFGQSIIADDSVLKRADSEESIHLEKMAKKVIEKINRHIENKEHFFHFNNHKTNAPDSIHKEQLRSATYYAYRICKIPAFGIESAKFLPLEQKVRQHIYAI
ncbi:MAG: succinylglutamate desuccinylase/aspartoacylase family protein, partial [Desulfobacteraceae bacterium]|nr:succinylglutamate desuccinylase/aspartoacylase family protein [Desulfobacteraceae bacterium]